MTDFVDFFFSISKNKLEALLAHYKQNGLAPRVLKSGGRRKENPQYLKLCDTERVRTFILHYAEDHAVNLPGRVPGFKRDDIKLLPSSHTKSIVYKSYGESADRTGKPAQEKITIVVVVLLRQATNSSNNPWEWSFACMTLFLCLNLSLKLSCLGKKNHF